MITDIFIKSYPKDYEWLSYALRSISKFVTGTRNTIVLSPSTVMAPDWRYVPEREPGYLWQQVCKLNAGSYSDADFILYHDSDCIYTTPFKPEDMLTADGKVKLLRTPYAVIEKSYAEHGEVFPWRQPTQTVLNRPVEFEYMRRFPFLIPRQVLIAFDGFVVKTHRVTVCDYIMRESTFSEFNALLAFAADEFPHLFEFTNTEEVKELPPTVIRQFWSHAGVEAHRTEIERILA